jgi:hypothetical protein
MELTLKRVLAVEMGKWVVQGQADVWRGKGSTTVLMGEARQWTSEYSDKCLLFFLAKCQ